MATVLIVDDNAMNVDMLSQRLKRKGFVVLSANDGAEAIETTRRERPDIVLMDMSLPVMDGWEATRQLKSDPALRDIPVIALTAHALEDDRQKALAAGCDDYDSKPVELKRLLGKMNDLLAFRAAS